MSSWFSSASGSLTFSSVSGSQCSTTGIWVSARVSITNASMGMPVGFRLTVAIVVPIRSPYLRVWYCTDFDGIAGVALPDAVPTVEAPQYFAGGHALPAGDRGVPVAALAGRRFVAAAALTALAALLSAPVGGPGRHHRREDSDELGAVVPLAVGENLHHPVDGGAHAHRSFRARTISSSCRFPDVNVCARSRACSRSTQASATAAGWQRDSRLTASIVRARAVGCILTVPVASRL